MDDITVTKRDGSIKKLQIEKITRMIDTAFIGVSISATELLHKLKISFFDGIPTSEIQRVIIHEAKLFIVPDGDCNNQWSLVVGRLEMYDLHGVVYKNIGLLQNEFVEGYRYLQSIGSYTFDFDTDLLEYASSILDLEVDFDQPTQAVVSLKSSYLVNNLGKYVEYPQWAIMADALITSNGNKTKLLEDYTLFKLKLESSSTPVKKNLRIGGNTASCFSIMASDNIENIMDTVKEAALISKSGGGLAVYVGKIRPEGSTIQNTKGAGTHINKWVKFFDLVAYTVDQLGSRKAAITVANDWFHLDFMEFMEISTEDGGDIRKKAFDILPQFLLNSYLLKKVQTKEDVYLVNNYDCIQNLQIDLTELVENEWVKAYEVVLNNLNKVAHKKVNAYSLWVSIWDNYFKVGKINITNKDGINSNNYLRKHFKAQTGNLCLESFSINTEEYDHTCNLMSINLAEVVRTDVLSEHKDLNSKIRYVVRNTVDNLNRIIDVSTFPTEKTKASARDLRNTGIGIVGGADWLAYQNMTYDKNGIKELERVMEVIAYYAYERSIELAGTNGSYPLYHMADYSTMFNHTPEELNKLSLNGFDWIALNKRIKTEGIRNFLLLSPAPNAGTGIVLGASPNFLPVTSLCHFKDMQKMTPVIVPPFADTKFPYYRTRGSFDGVFYLELSAAIQRWTDTGVSNEIGVNPDLFSMKDFSDKVIELMLKNELKAVYYMAETACTTCAN